MQQDHGLEMALVTLWVRDVVSALQEVFVAETITSHVMRQVSCRGGHFGNLQAVGQLLPLPGHPQTSSPIRLEGSAVYSCQDSWLSHVTPEVLPQFLEFCEDSSSISKSCEPDGCWERLESMVQA